MRRRVLTCVLASALAVALPAQDLLSTPEPVLAGREPVLRLALSADAGTALLHERDGSLRLVDLAAARTLRRFAAPAGKVTALALAGPQAAAFVATERVLWTLPAGTEGPARKLWEAESEIAALSLSPDLDLIAAATPQGVVVLRPDTGAVAWKGPAGACAAVCFAPMGGTLALAAGRTVEIRNVPGFAPRQVWTLNFPVLALAYAPDARTLAVAGGHESLLVKRVADGQTVKYLNVDLAGRDINMVAFAGDGSALFAAAGRRLQSFAGLDQPTPAARLSTTEEPLLALAYSKPAGALFAAGDGRSTLSRWAVTRTPLAAAARPREGQPALTVLGPVAGAKVTTGSVDLTFKLAFPADRPATAIRVLADGRPARITTTAASGAAPGEHDGGYTGAFQSGRIYSCKVAVPDRDTTLLVLADGAGGASEPELVPLQRSALARPKGGAKVVPPSITRLRVDPAAQEVLFRVESAPGQPVTLVRLTLDGVPLPLQGLILEDGSPFDPGRGWNSGATYRVPVQIPAEEVTLTAVAESAFAAGAPAEVRVAMRPATVAATARPADGEPAAPAKPAEPEDPGKVKAFADATRILEGGPQGAAVPMEVDAKGRLRWRDKPAENGKKAATTRGAAAGPAAAATPAAFKAGGPTVQVLAPAAGTRFKEREVPVTVKLGGPAGLEVNRIQVYIDGNPAGATVQGAGGAPLNPPFPHGQPIKLLVAVPPQDCQLSILAEGGEGAGRPALLRLKYDGKAAPAGTTRGVSQLAKPRLAIFEPQPNALVRGGAVRLGVRVGLDPRQPPPGVRILVDAQEVKAERVTLQAGTAPMPTGDRGGTEDIQYYTIPIPPKDCTVVAYAETPYATSDPSLVKLRWDAPALASSATGLPTLYLLAVGVAKYKDRNLSLTYPAKDARDFAEVMRQQKGRLYKDVVARVRTDETASRDNIMDDLEWIQRQATQRDVVIVFFAGHGINDVVTGNYYYLPHDASIDAVKRTMIPGSEIHSTLARLTGTRLLFMDTCHAGNVTGTATRGVPDLRQFLQDLKEGGQGLVVITSSRPGQKSQEHPSWNNGAFTKALVEGLKGKASKDKQGFITFTALDAYITQRVKELTKGTQGPATQKSTEVSDFPLAFTEN